ncbi:MAG TPA: hypothetical protein VGL11_15800 [Candidatus Binatia bacterium]
MVVVSTEKKTLGSIKNSASCSLSEEIFQKVSFFTPEELLSSLDETAAEAASKEETVRGYKVKVKYRSLNASDTSARKQAIAKTIVEAMRRMKEQ